MNMLCFKWHSTIIIVQVFGAGYTESCTIKVRHILWIQVYVYQGMPRGTNHTFNKYYYVDRDKLKFKCQYN